MGGRRFKIAEMLTESAVDLYSQKARASRSRLFRADSQESIASTFSALSYDRDEEDNHSQVDEMEDTSTDQPETGRQQET